MAVTELPTADRLPALVQSWSRHYRAGPRTLTAACEIWDLHGLHEVRVFYNDGQLTWTRHDSYAEALQQFEQLKRFLDERGWQ